MIAQLRPAASAQLICTHAKQVAANDNNVSFMWLALQSLDYTPIYEDAEIDA